MSQPLFPRLLIICSILLASPFTTSDLDAQPAPSQNATQSNLQSPPWLGVLLEKSTLHAENGVKIERVMRKSPAEKAGILPGDHVLEINGQPVQSTGKLQMLMRGQAVGETVTISILRKGKRLELQALLTPTPDETQMIENQVLHEFAPALTLEILSPETRSLQLAQLKGRPTIITFWATWCVPCKTVASELAQLQTQYPQQIHILSISSESTETISGFLKKNGAPAYFIARDIGEAGHGAFAVRSYPVVFLLNAEHRIEGVYVGRNQQKQLKTHLKKLLASTDSTSDSHESKKQKADP